MQANTLGSMLLMLVERALGVDTGRRMRSAARDGVDDALRQRGL